MQNERDNATNPGLNGFVFVAGLFAGVAIGAGVGLLFAPRQGSALRRHIKDSASAAGQRVSDTIESVADAGRGAYQQARDVAATASGEFGRMAGDVSRSAEKSVTAIRDAALRPRRSDGGSRI